MAGTKAGGIKARKTVYEKYGKDHYKNIGAKSYGIPRTKPSGFAAMTPEKRREAGRKGGLSRAQGYKDKQA